MSDDLFFSAIVGSDVGVKATVEHRRKRRTVPQAIALSDLVTYRTVPVTDQSVYLKRIVLVTALM